MHRTFSIRGWIWLLALAGTGAVWADEPAFDSGLLRYDWLQSADQQQAQPSTAPFTRAVGHEPGRSILGRFLRHAVAGAGERFLLAPHRR